MDKSGQNLRQLTDHQSADRDAVWSAHGQQIIFVSNRSGNDEIYSMNLNGGNIRQLTNHPAPDRQPSSSTSFLSVHASQHKMSSLWGAVKAKQSDD